MEKNIPLKESLCIVKIGGNIINDGEALKAFLQDFSRISKPKLLIHGGGKLLDDLAARLGIAQQMLDGRRITDRATLDLAIMVYAGLINKQIVALLQAAGQQAIGLSGADANVLKASKRRHPQIDFGWVGDLSAEGVNHAFLHGLTADKMIPVLSALSHDGAGNMLNTNADTLASVVAVAMRVYYSVQLYYCFEKQGVLADPADEDSVVPVLYHQDYHKLKEQKRVIKGMIPKLDNAFAALQQGVNDVYILHAVDLLKNINSGHHVGTHLSL